MYPATAIAALPVIHDPEPVELSAPLITRRSDELTTYVACAVGEGRTLFDVLGDRFVLDEMDEYVSVLDHLAREPAVREALARQQRGEPPAVHPLAA